MTSRSPTRSSIRLVTVSLLLAPWLLSARPLSSQAIALLAPTGPFALGTRVLHLVDQARAETAPGHTSERRELMVQLWYPAQSASTPPAPYMLEFARVAAHKKELKDRGLALLGQGIDRLERVTTHAQLDAPMLPGPARWPVVLFSPGNSLPRSIYTMLVQDLASHGFVVAAIDHPYSSAIVLLPGGRVAMDAGPEAPVVPFETRVRVRTADIRFVLDELRRLDVPIDATRAGVFGHSIGGVAAVQASADDARFVAAANLDGGTGEMADTLTRGPKSPVMLITKAVPSGGTPTDQTLGQWGLTRAQYDDLMAKDRASRDALYAAMPSVAYRVTIAGAQHMSFSDAPFLERDYAQIVVSRVLGITAIYLRAFFDRHLRGTDATLLEKLSLGYPEVRFERYPR